MIAECGSVFVGDQVEDGRIVHRPKSGRLAFGTMPSPDPISRAVVPQRSPRHAQPDLDRGAAEPCGDRDVLEADSADLAEVVPEIGEQIGPPLDLLRELGALHPNPEPTGRGAGAKRDAPASRERGERGGRRARGREPGRLDRRDFMMVAVNARTGRRLPVRSGAVRDGDFGSRSSGMAGRNTGQLCRLALPEPKFPSARGRHDARVWQRVRDRIRGGASHDVGLRRTELGRLARANAERFDSLGARRARRRHDGGFGRDGRRQDAVRP